MIDLIYVTYNSEKWIAQCFDSILDNDYDLKQINVIVVDNASTDKTVNILQNKKSKMLNHFASFNIIQNKNNEGFGKANNIGFSKGCSEFVCFFNIDTRLFKNTLSVLTNVISHSEKDVALWELRQFPYEHPKMYDPVSMETEWCSGAAFAVKRDIFKKINGFDETLFMYAEDVDLSWRIRCLGYKIKYIPKARIYHYTYENVQTIKLTQHVYGVVNNLLLRYRFGTFKDILIGHMLFCRVMALPPALKGSKQALLKTYARHFSKIVHFYQGGMYKHNSYFLPLFTGFDYGLTRMGSFYLNQPLNNTPLVSVIVRTHQRPDILKEALISLRNQTYPNIEVVIVEDGANQSEQMIQSEFSNINIRYFATGQKVGRSKAGNLAIQKASGKYINFLDDDDLFFADHVEVLVNVLEHSTEKAAYSIGLETSIQITSLSPYRYKIKKAQTIHHQPFDRIMLCHHNYIPIQCIMFSRELFDLYGGLDESVDALEDWDLWVRYSLHTDFVYVEKTTSIYRIPYDTSQNDARQKILDNTLIEMREKHKNYMQKISVYDIAKIYEKD